MQDSIFKRALGFFGYVVLIFTFLIPIIPAGAIHIFQANHITCKDVPIEYRVIEKDDPSISSLSSHTSVQGKNGVERKCTNDLGEDKGSFVKSYPLNQVNTVGSLFEPYVEPVYKEESYGSTCNDGTRSPSSGRGTCSWHDGVAY